MIRKIALVICVLFVISCEKEDSMDLLTKGTWKAVSGLQFQNNETIKFNSDGTFVQELPDMNSPLPDYTGFSSYKTSVKLSGDWSFNNHDIQFTNPVVSIPQDTSSVLTNGTYKINIVPGQAIGGLFGYRYLGVYQDDSTRVIMSPVFGLNKLIMGTDTTTINGYNLDSLQLRDPIDSWSWTIIKLTEDSLVVNSNDLILRYYR